jgi:hypothetical protein
MEDDPICLYTAGEPVEVFRKMLDHISADGMCLLASFLPIGEGGKGADSACDTAFGIGVKSLLEVLIVDGTLNAMAKRGHEV